jgi:hypothetical protein
LFYLSISFLFTACGSAKKDEAKTRKAGGCSSINARVHGGESCKESARTPVVKLFISLKNGQVGTCSATLVSAKDILSSAHCFMDGIDEVVALIGGKNGEWIPVVEYAIHPEFGFAPGDPFDVAMATLKSSPKPTVSPIAISEKKKSKKETLPLLLVTV